DPLDLARRATPEQLESTTYGIDPRLFGPQADEQPAGPGDLVVSAPSVIELRVPAELVVGSDFVTSGSLLGDDSGEGSVQLQLLMEPPDDAAALIPGVPVVVNPGSPAESRFRTSMDAFRDLFPLAMCYPRIVPVDVVVTLVLFHREDEHLQRLMLSEEET